MATLYEYNTSHNNNTSVYGSLVCGTTFTPQVTHAISQVIVRIARIASVVPGYVYVKIYECDGSGISGGVPIAEGSIPAESITHTSTCYDVTFNLSSTPTLIAGNIYKILVSVPSGDSSHQFWARTQLSNTYPRGVAVYWGENSLRTGYDFYFKEYGNPVSLSVSTQAASSIGATQATLNGNITTAVENATIRGFDIGTSPGVYTDDITESGSFGTGAFSLSATNLNPGQTYYVRAKALGSLGWAYGDEVSFTTEFSVWTMFAAGITKDAATLYGGLDSGYCDEIGFEWGDVMGGPYPNSSEVSLYTPTFTLDIDTLLADHTYYFRAYAIHPVHGTQYGDEVSFQTLPDIPVVQVNTPTTVGDNSFTALGDILNIGAASPDARGFVYSLTSYSKPGPTVAPADSDYGGYTMESGTFGTGAFSASITGLTTRKFYYVRAWAHNTEGYGYSDEIKVLVSKFINMLSPSGMIESGIRFESPKGEDHWRCVLNQDSEFHAPGAYGFGYVSGNYVYEQQYYQDNWFRDIYSMTNPIERSEGIVKVKWRGYILGNQYPGTKYKTVIKSGATILEGSPASAGPSTGHVCVVHRVDPNTGLPWTLSGVDNMGMGVSLYGGTGFGKAVCDWIAAMVLWLDAAVTTISAEGLGGTDYRLKGFIVEDEMEPCTVYFEWGYSRDNLEYKTADQTTKVRGDNFTADIRTDGNEFFFRAVIETACGETFYGATKSFLMYPTDPITRVTSIIHRYNRGIYSMELGFGDVVAGLTIPQPDIVVKKSVEPSKEEQEEKETPHVKPPVFQPYTAPDPFPASDKVTAPQPPPPTIKDSSYSNWDYFKMGLTPWNEPAGESWQSYQEEQGGFLPAVGGVLHHVGSTVWQTITPWKEEEGETFGSEISERWQSFTGFLGRLFK